MKVLKCNKEGQAERVAPPNKSHLEVTGQLAAKAHLNAKLSMIAAGVRGVSLECYCSV